MVSWTHPSQHHERHHNLPLLQGSQSWPTDHATPLCSNRPHLSCSNFNHHLKLWRKVRCENIRFLTNVAISWNSTRHLGTMQKLVTAPWLDFMEIINTDISSIMAEWWNKCIVASSHFRCAALLNCLDPSKSVWWLGTTDQDALDVEQTKMTG